MAKGLHPETCVIRVDPVDLIHQRSPRQPDLWPVCTEKYHVKEVFERFKGKECRLKLLHIGMKLAQEMMRAHIDYDDFFISFMNRGARYYFARYTGRNEKYRHNQFMLRPEDGAKFINNLGKLASTGKSYEGNPEPFIREWWKRVRCYFAVANPGEIEHRRPRRKWRRRG